MKNYLSKYLNHYKSLVMLGMPIVIGQIGVIVVSFADTLMVGHHSTLELAAASFVNTLFMLVIVFALGFSYALTPIVGNLFGKNDHKGIGIALINNVVANISLSLLLILILTVVYFNISLLGQPEELYPYIKPYFIINLVSLPFILWFNSFRQFSDGITDTKTSMWIMLSGNILNIICNWLLIYGVGFFPELGLLGAGLSTLLSRIFMAVMFTCLFLRKSKYIRFREGFKISEIKRSELAAHNKLGWPLALQMGMETAAFSLTGIMVGWLGVMELAAHQILLTISQLFYMVYYGMGAAVAVRVSYFAGQNDHKQLYDCSKAGLHIILFIAVCVAVPIWMLSDNIGYLFTDNSEVCLLVSAVILPMVLYQFGDGMQCNYANALRGIRVVKPLMTNAFIAYFVVSLPLSYIFGFVFNWRLLGIWFAFPFGLTCAGILFYICFRRSLKRAYNSDSGHGLSA